MLARTLAQLLQDMQLRAQLTEPVSDRMGHNLVLRGLLLHEARM